MSHSVILCEGYHDRAFWAGWLKYLHCIDSGATKVALVRWEASDPDGPGLPQQQTLERLVCAALIAAYPTRAKSVQDWLDSRPQPPGTHPKEHAWSHMAGWYADQGCEAF